MPLVLPFKKLVDWAAEARRLAEQAAADQAQAARMATAPTEPAPAPPPPPPPAEPAPAPARPTPQAQLQQGIEEYAATDTGRPAPPTAAAPVPRPEPVEGPPPQAPSPVPAPTARTYAPEIEAWRSLVAAKFPAAEVDKMLYVIQGESGGRANAVGDGGHSYGGFQSQSDRAKLGTAEQQVQDAYERWQARGYADWGENNLYNGKPFGALGRNPYPGTAGAARAVRAASGFGGGAGPQAARAGRPLTWVSDAGDLPSGEIPKKKPPAFLAEAVETGKLKVYKRPSALSQDKDLPDTWEQLYQAVDRAARSVGDEDEARRMTAAFAAEIRKGESPGTAWRRLVAQLQDAAGNVRPVGFTAAAEGIDFKSPLGWLAFAALPGQAIGEGLAAVARPGTEKLPPAVGERVSRGLELGGYFATPGGGAKAILKRMGVGGATSLAGGEATEAAGAGRATGEMVGPFAPGLLRRGLPKAILRNLAKEGEGGRQIPEGYTDPTPLPGQEGLFGEKVLGTGRVELPINKGDRVQFLTDTSPREFEKQFGVRPTGGWVEGIAEEQFGNNWRVRMENGSFATVRRSDMEFLAEPAPRGPPPEMGSMKTDAEVFRGEQGGAQPGMFGAAAIEPGAKGYAPRLEEAASAPEPRAPESPELVQLRAAYKQQQAAGNTFAAGRTRQRIAKLEAEAGAASPAPTPTGGLKPGDRVDTGATGPGTIRGPTSQGPAATGWVIDLDNPNPNASRAAQRTGADRIVRMDKADVKPLAAEAPPVAVDPFQNPRSPASRGRSDAQRNAQGNVTIEEISNQSQYQMGLSAHDDDIYSLSRQLEEDRLNGTNLANDPEFKKSLEYITPAEEAAIRAQYKKPTVETPAGPPDLGALPSQPARKVIPASDLEYRPDLFQTRDVTPGKPFEERRVQQIVENYNPAQFTTPDVIPDPARPGKYIVMVGQHRTEAYRRFNGPDAPIEVNVQPYDIRDPQQLAKAQLHADQSNATTRPLNVREEIRNLERAEAAGESRRQVAGRLGKNEAYADKLRDIGKVGAQAVDRVVQEPALTDHASEIGRGMRLYGINAEDANGLFNRVAAASKGTRPTPTMLRETIDKFGKALAEIPQGALFEVGKLEGTQGGFLGLIAKNAEVRTQLQRSLNDVKRAQKGAQSLAAGKGEGARVAADRLVKLGQDDVKRIQAALKANEDDVARALRGEPPKPPEAEKPPVAPKARAPSEPPKARVRGGAAGPPPVGAHTQDDVDWLIAAVQEAGGVRPDLLARRSEELGKRVAQMAANLEADGAPPAEALAKARRALKGQLADPSFNVPTPAEGTVDRLHQTIIATPALQLLSKANAADALNKLAAGINVAPHEAEKLGQVFGPRLQFAIEDMGAIFQVQRRATEVVKAYAPAITWPDGSPITPEALADALRARMPGVPDEVLTGAARRMIDTDAVAVNVDSAGIPRLTVKRESTNALTRAINDAVEGVDPYYDIPAQEWPPSQTDIIAGTTEQSFQVAPRTVGAPAMPTLATELRKKADAARIQEAARLRREGPPAEVPRQPGGTPPKQGEIAGRDWKPGRPLWQIAAGGLKEVVILLASRALQAGGEFSYLLRQAGTQTRRPQFWRALDDLVKGAWSEDYAVTRMKQLDQLPYKSSRTHLSPLHGGPGAKLTEREESFMSNLADKVPFFRQTQRAVTLFVNDLRANAVNDFGKNMARHPGAFNLDELDSFADYVNRATGRGNLGLLEDHLATVNQVFYSLRRNVAMVQAPFYLFNKYPSVRMEAMKDLVAFIGVGATTLELAHLAGADVSLDPTSADFGKIRIGNTRIDIWGGYQQMARAVYNIADGEIKDPSVAAFTVPAVRFLRQKLAPMTGLGVDIAVGENMIGEERRSAKAMLKGFGNTQLAMAWVSLYEAMKEDGIVAGSVSLSGLLGTGVQSYESTVDARDRKAQELNPGKDFDQLLPDKQDEVKKALEAEGVTRPSPEVKRLRERTAAIDQEQADVEVKFKAGTLVSRLGDEYKLISRSRRDLSKDFQTFFASQIAKYPETRLNSITEPYYAIEKVDADGNFDWDATEAARAAYVAGLSDETTGDMPSDRAVMTASLRFVESKKSPLLQQRNAFMDAKEAAGYFKEGLTTAEIQALDKAHPDLDVLSWYFGSGTVDKSKTPALQSADAVAQALALIDKEGLKGRDVKLAGLSRPVNESPETLKAWEASGKSVAAFQAQFTPKVREAITKAEFGAGYTYDQLGAVAKEKIDGKVNAARMDLIERDPVLNAWLVWWGRDLQLKSVAALSELQKIIKQYGKSPPKPDFKGYELAENAR